VHVPRASRASSANARRAPGVYQRGPRRHGANLVVTTGYQVDRRSVVAGERLVPDETVPGPPPGWPSATDAPARAAATWLQGTAACRR
jgi:hypothetical protein